MIFKTIGSGSAKLPWLAGAVLALGIAGLSYADSGWPGAQPGSAAGRGVGCEPLSIVSRDFRNNAKYSFDGGACGGWVEVSVSFSGERAPTGNTSSDRITRAGIVSPCNARDRHFDSFNLSCQYRMIVAPNSRPDITVAYTTNEVNDDPLPRLYVRLEYHPGQPPFWRPPPESRPAPQPQQPPPQPQRPPPRYCIWQTQGYYWVKGNILNRGHNE